MDEIDQELDALDPFPLDPIRPPIPAPRQDEPRTIEDLRALINYQSRTRPSADIDTLAALAVFKPMKDTMGYIQRLSTASIFTQPNLSPNALQRLLHPPNTPLVIDDPITRFSISTYLSLESASQASYTGIVEAFKFNLRHIPGIGDPLSFHAVESLIGTFTGVEPILEDMCPDSCVAFTGPYSDLDACPICQAS
jgi:hypothetical protein